MNIMKTSLFKIIIGYVFIILFTAFGNQHIFPVDQMISKVNISGFPDDCLHARGPHPTMSFSDDGKQLAVWNDEYAEIYDLSIKDAKPVQRLELAKNSPWGKIYRGKSSQAVSITTGNIIFNGTAQKYIPLLYSSSLLPDNFKTLKSYVSGNEELMKKYHFLLQKKALCVNILGGYKLSLQDQPSLLGSIDFKPIVFFGQTTHPFKEGSPFNSMLSSDMTRACISCATDALFSFYQGKKKVMDITPDFLGLEHKRWMPSFSSLSDDGALLLVTFIYAGRFTAPWNFKTAIAFIDTKEKKAKGIRVLSGSHPLTCCFSNDKSKIAVWKNREKEILVFHFP
ncbi:MAG: hypothetical protein LUE13_07780 [Akkermansiaceae bacterium]|nr:hypothetical protein [Akkermansiaceae bacterium]